MNLKNLSVMAYLRIKCNICAAPIQIELGSKQAVHAMETQRGEVEPVCDECNKRLMDSVVLMDAPGKVLWVSRTLVKKVLKDYDLPEQLYDVYGVDAETLKEVTKRLMEL